MKLRGPFGKLSANLGLRRGIIIFGFFLSTPLSQAEQAGDSPYIDSLRREMNAEEASASDQGVLNSDHPLTDQGSYTDYLRKKLDVDDAKAAQDAREGVGRKNPRASFIEETKLTNPERFDPDSALTGNDSFLTNEKAKLPIEEEGGAIQALAEGRSDLHAKKKGDIRQSYGFRYGLNPQRSITGPSEYVARPFGDVYGAKYAPDVSFFYEYQLFHSELLGSLGLMGLGGISYFHGSGKFALQLKDPSGGFFPVQSNTQFQFFILPMTLAASYRFNLFYILRPYIIVGPSLVGYVEMRNDALSGNKGYSQGIFYAVGVSLLLDWLSKSGSWELYTSQGVHHFYISLDYSRLAPLSGDVRFTISGLSLGLTFEF